MPMGPPQPQPHHGPGNGVVMGHPGSGVVINDVSHPLSSANPPGLPRPPLHPAMSHTHGHSHLIAPGGGATLQHNGSPMQRITHSGGHAAKKNEIRGKDKFHYRGLPHHGGHGPAPPPPTHINNPPSSSHHPMSNLSSTGTSTSAAGGSGSGNGVNGAGPGVNGGQVAPPQQQPSQSLVSNGGLNGHANMGTQLFGDTEPENEKWWWVCCLEFCFCLL